MLAEIRTKLEEFGVSNFVVAFSDPDENLDKVSVFGSKYWRLGFAVDLEDETRRDLGDHPRGDSEPT